MGDLLDGAYDAPDAATGSPTKQVEKQKKRKAHHPEVHPTSFAAQQYKLLSYGAIRCNQSTAGMGGGLHSNADGRNNDTIIRHHCVVNATKPIQTEYGVPTPNVHMRDIFTRRVKLLEELWSEMHVARMERDTFAAQHYWPQTTENYKKLFAEIRRLTTLRSKHHKVLKLIEWREMCLERLERLTSLFFPAEESVRQSLLQNEIVNVILLLRRVTFSVARAIVLWRTGQTTLRPFLWGSTNYMLKMQNDLRFLGGTTIEALLNCVIDGNPFLLPDRKRPPLPSGATQRAIRKFRKQSSPRDLGGIVDTVLASVVNSPSRPLLLPSSSPIGTPSTPTTTTLGYVPPPSTSGSNKITSRPTTAALPRHPSLTSSIVTSVGDDTVISTRPSSQHGQRGWTPPLAPPATTLLDNIPTETTAIIDDPMGSPESPITRPHHLRSPSPIMTLLSVDTDFMGSSTASVASAASATGSISSSKRPSPKYFATIRGDAPVAVGAPAMSLGTLPLSSRPSSVRLTSDGEDIVSGRTTVRSRSAKGTTLRVPPPSPLPASSLPVPSARRPYSREGGQDPPEKVKPTTVMTPNSFLPMDPTPDPRDAVPRRRKKHHWKGSLSHGPPSPVRKANAPPPTVRPPVDMVELLKTLPKTRAAKQWAALRPSEILTGGDSATTAATEPAKYPYPVEVILGTQPTERQAQEDVAGQRLEHMLTPSTSKRHITGKVVQFRPPEPGECKRSMQQVFEDQFKAKYVARGKLPPVLADMLEQQRQRHSTEQIKQSFVLVDNELPLNALLRCEGIIFGEEAFLQRLSADATVKGAAMKIQAAWKGYVQRQRAQRRLLSATVRESLRAPRKVDDAKLTKVGMQHCRDLLTGPVSPRFSMSGWAGRDDLSDDELYLPSDTDEEDDDWQQNAYYGTQLLSELFS